MKRIWNHPEPLDQGVTTWNSPGQLADTPEFREWVQREFPQGVAELSGEEDSDLSRRSFLKFMGASTALAGFGLAACRKPVSYLIPFTDNVEWAIPGRPLYYATAMPRGDWSWPVLATTIDGRPTHLSGNQKHPEGHGLDHFGTAEVIQMYDPDRSAHYLKSGQSTTREEFDGWLNGLLAQAGQGAGIAFLLGDGSTPTELRLLQEIQTRLPQAGFFRYEAISQAAARSAAAKRFGAGARELPRLADARRILSLDCDFLHLEMPSPLAAQEFHASHKPENPDGTKRSAEEMARLYVAETAFSLTGGMADHRLRLNYAGVLRFAVALARELGTALGDAGLQAAAAQTGVNEPFAAEEKPWHGPWLREVAADLAAHRGTALILAGQKHGEALHLLTSAMNQALQAPVDVVVREELPAGNLEDLYTAIGSGQVRTLISLTPGDPVFDAPARESSFAALLGEKEITLVHHGLQPNDTARAANWHVPAAHWLESWNDGLSPRGRYTVAQPMIEPLVASESTVEFLLRFLPAPAPVAGETVAVADEPARAAVRTTFFAALGSQPGTGPANVDDAAEVAWENCLRQGFQEFSLPAAPAGGGLDPAQFAAAWEAGKRQLPIWGDNGADGLEIVFAADASLWDGRYVNNAWLQEAPDPVTKLTWDNAALISPETAVKLGPLIGMPDLADRLGAQRAVTQSEDGFVAAEDNAKAHVWQSKDRNPPIVKLRVNGTEVEVALLLAFGHANDSITVHLGYGRQNAGRVGDGLDGKGVGFNIHPLRNARNPHVGKIEAITPTGRDYAFGLTAEHHTMFGRGLVVESPLETDGGHHSRGYLEGGYTTKAWIDAHAPSGPTQYRAEDWEGKPLINDELHQWGMVIDLTSCTGCNACLVACQSENNIPVVGKAQVRMGREMHWIRMDRYFSNRTRPRQQEGPAAVEPNQVDPGNPEMLTQPVACQQCEYAPCETVCPVNATVHSEDGLNLMAYNRCIGTRYCANNCPYKARRFNFFDYNKRPLENLYQGPLGGANGLGNTTLKAQKNPNVTVRMRGVMEKCTYCIQRIQEAKIDAKAILRTKTNATGQPSELVTISNDELRIPTGHVGVACADACPGESIVFGNLLDPNDPIVKLKHFEQVGQTRSLVHDHPRSYDLLAYIGTRPRTSYLARVRNLNPRLPESRYRGEASVNID